MVLNVDFNLRKISLRLLHNLVETNMFNFLVGT